MAERGRKPKPTALKLLEGNPGKRKLNKREPKPSKDIPSCPDWLDDEAKNEWNRLADGLNKMGLLTKSDMASFAGYCQCYSRWKENEEYITEHGALMTTPSGYLQQIPQVGMSHRYLAQMKDFASEFGLTPVARSRISTDSKTTNESDDMDALLGGEGY